MRIVLAFWGLRYFVEGHWPLAALAVVGLSPLIGGQAIDESSFSRRAGISVVIGVVLLLLGPHGFLSYWYEPSPYELLVEMMSGRE
jgi:hypothetical protein